MKRLSKMIVGLAICIALLVAGHQSSQALDFAVYPLDELSELSDTILTGSVMSSKKAEDNKLIYKVKVDEGSKGEPSKGNTISVKVLQWSDEGKLKKGERYLFLLIKDENAAAGKELYAITGVHQGFILLKDGSTTSRFYSTAEVEKLLQKLEVDSNIVINSAKSKSTDTPKKLVESVQKEIESQGKDDRLIIGAVVLCICIALYFIFRFKRRNNGK